MAETLSFDYWSHGGDPGTVSRDFLVKKDGKAYVGLVRESGRVFGEGPSREMNVVFKMPLEKKEAQAFFDQVIASGVLKQKKNFRKDVADLLIEEWELVTEKESIKSQFTSPFPAKQDEIRGVCAALIKKTKDHHLVELAKAKAIEEKIKVSRYRATVADLGLNFTVTFVDNKSDPENLDQDREKLLKGFEIDIDRADLKVKEIRHFD